MRGDNGRTAEELFQKIIQVVYKPDVKDADIREPIDAALRRAKAEVWLEASEIAWNSKSVLAVYDECRARAAQIEEGE